MVKAVYLDLLIATALVCLWEPRLLVVFFLTVVGHRYIRKMVETQHRRGLDMLGKRLPRETQELIQLEDWRREQENRPGVAPVSMILWGVLALVGVGFYAYEPSQPVVSEPAAAVEAPQAAGAAAIPQAPPGMVYDKEHNSFHYPAVPVLVPNQTGRHP